MTNEWGSKLWLGVSVAGRDANLLLKNNIGAVWAARSTVEPGDTAAVKVLHFMDGTGVVRGTPDFDIVMSFVDTVLSSLYRGTSVLVTCHNGAHRSATLTALILMRITGLSATEVNTYLTSLRNIVDLSSRAPPSARRVTTRRPIDFLEAVQGRVVPESHLVGAKAEIVVSGRYASELLTPLYLRHKAMELGFVAGSKKAKLRLPPTPPEVPQQRAPPSETKIALAEEQDTTSSQGQGPKPLRCGRHRCNRGRLRGPQQRG